MTSEVDRVREELAAQFRATVRERVASVTKRWMALEAQGAWREVDDLLGELHTLKGESRLMDYVGCSTLVHAAEELVARNRHQGAPPAAATGDLLFAILANVEHRTNGKSTEDSPTDATVRELLLKARGAEAAGADTTGEAEAVARQTQAPASIATVGRTEDTAIRDLRAETLDAFSDTARELVATHVRYEIALREMGRALQAAANGHQTAIQDALAGHGVLTEEVHRGHVHAARMNQHALTLRLSPVQRTFDRFTRPVRDLGRSLGKNVVLETSGGEVMLDRHVVDRLFDPLMHLLRNAVDHGIEAPEAREGTGKPARATIRLSVTHMGSRAVVRLADDGGGFDLEAIRRRAERLGMLDDRRQRSAEELIALTFTPGFSTREHATETSGRGVGLDVVKRVVDQIGGQLHVSSVPGRGSTFDLDVPATLSLTEVLLVSAGDRSFALPTRGLRSVASTEEAKPHTINGRSAIVLHDEPIPYVSLTAVLGMPQSASRRAVVVATDRGRVAVGVDEWREMLECVVTPLPRRLSADHLLVGATVIGGGTMALVLNTSELLLRALGNESAHSAMPAETKPVEKRRERRVLLVEDSVITRTMLARLLAAAGYAVREAQDGAHALELLDAERFDVVLTDLDMPRLDGFGLIEAIRANDQYKHLPIVVLTTRGAAADKARATSAGANAYLTKTAFSEADLRAALEKHHD